MCGSEVVTAVNETALTKTVIIGEDSDDIVIAPSEIESEFATTGAQCNLTYSHAATSVGPDGLAAANWSSYVTFDHAAAGLTIRHLGTYPPGDPLNYTISIFLRALSAGKKGAFREVIVQFMYAVHNPPLFEPVLESVTLSVDLGKVANGT